MARIEQVIHVKGTDGVVQECALFDASSDIPSPATAREFGLNGAKIYGAALQGDLFVVGSDEQWLYANSGTELAFHDGSGESYLLTTPYFVRPKTDALEFGADGGTVYLEDYSLKTETYEGILSTNGTLSDYSCDRDFISLVNEGTKLMLRWTVVCGANTSASERSFTLTLTYSFADGSTQDITFTGTQAAGEVREVWLRVDPDSLSFGADGGRQFVEVDSSSDDWEVESVDGDWITTTVTHVAGSLTGTVRVTAASNTETSARSGSVTLANGDGCTAEIAVEQEAGVTPVPGERTLTINVTKSGAATLEDDWRYDPPMVTVYAGASVIVGLIELTTRSMTWTGTTDDGAEVTYTVSKDGYTTVTGSVTMDSDKEVHITLHPSS